MEFPDQETKDDHQGTIGCELDVRITMPRNHATAVGGMKPTTQPTVIWRTPRNQSPTPEVRFQAVDVSCHIWKVIVVHGGC